MEWIIFNNDVNETGEIYNIHALTTHYVKTLLKRLFNIWANKFYKC